MDSLCRACLASPVPGARCPACGGARLLRHPELFALSIAHIDCDAFYAAVEKRDSPGLRDLPVIVGGGERGVVTTCCYLARLHGIRSAMPMFQARKLCPDAVVVRPRFEVYADVSRQIREKMDRLTPHVEPLSLDEAFLDLTGTARLHGAAPALLLAGLAAEIEREIGLTVSVGLSHNKFLAKLASELDKPRGFAVIGRTETLDRLAPMPVGRVWGVGPALRARLEADGLTTVGDIREVDQGTLVARYGAMGLRLWHLSRGEDARAIRSGRSAKSISNETTFRTDISDVEALEGNLWRMAERVSDRAKATSMAGRVALLKLKRSDHRLITRRMALSEPTQSVERLWDTLRPQLHLALDDAPFRLIGAGLADLVPDDHADRAADLLDAGAAKRQAAERATDAIRARFGAASIRKGRSIR